MELREEFSVCLTCNEEALSRVRVYLYKPFYLRERENAKLRGTILSENGEINKTWNMETSQYLRRTRKYVPPGRASIIDNRTNITTKKLLNLIWLKILYPNSKLYNPIVHLFLKRTSLRYIYWTKDNLKSYCKQLHKNLIKHSIFTEILIAICRQSGETCPSKIGRQMAIENPVSNDFWSTFVDSINVFDSRISGVQLLKIS